MQELGRSKAEEMLDIKGRDPHVVHVGTIGEFLAGATPQHLRKEPDEGLQQCWEGQWQEFLRVMQSPHFGWKNSQLQPPLHTGKETEGFQAFLQGTVDASKRQKDECMMQTFPALSGEIQRAYVCLDPLVKEEFLVEDDVSLDLQCEHRKPSGFQNAEETQEILGPSPKLEQDPWDAGKMQLSMEAKQEGEMQAILLGEVNVRTKEEENKLEELHDVLLGKAKGNIFPFSDKEEVSGRQKGAERGLENHPGQSVKKDFLCEDINESTIQQGIQQIFTLLENPGLQTAEKMYKCAYCGKPSSSRANLIIHERTHTGEKPYECSDCGRSFGRNGSLIIHKRIHTGEKPYECSDCGKSFGRNGSLIIHKRTHTGEKPYACPQCGKGFYCSSHLCTHQRMHLGEKPYKCSDCGKSFSENATLVIHKRSHTGEKPYECPECGKSFSRNTSLVRHKRAHMGEKPHKCSVCGKILISNSSLRKHLKVHIAEVRRNRTSYVPLLPLLPGPC